MGGENEKTEFKAEKTIEGIFKKIDEDEGYVLNQKEIDTLLTAIASEEGYKPLDG